MTAAQQGNQGQSNFMSLADDHTFDVGRNHLAGLLDARHLSLFWIQRLVDDPRAGRRVGVQARPPSWDVFRDATYYAQTT
jgi:hypothetical protein